MSIRKILLLVLLFVVSLSLDAQQKNKLYLRYIDEYKDVAMAHQKKYKIPASITLAQGLLESGAGQGRLASKSNNHFGIKCHNDWRGGRVYHDDDEIGECFRKYKNAMESYEDHSKFLTQKPRYAGLFELGVRNYKEWARGLQRCGYATDKAYASKLIRLIEDYELHQYDRMRGGSSKKNNVSSYMHQVYKSNDLLYVIAREDDSLEAIAKELDFKKSRLAKYNEIPEDYPLSDGDIVYLEKKNKKAPKNYLFHIVNAGESMYSISQKYGIRVKNLYKLNDKESDYVPAEGDVVKLR